MLGTPSPPSDLFMKIILLVVCVLRFIHFLTSCTVLLFSSFKVFFGNVHIGKQVLDFGEGYVPNCLKFHTGWQRALIYQVQSGRIFVADISHLFLSFTSHIKLMSEIAVSFVSCIDSNVTASYGE